MNFIYSVNLTSFDHGWMSVDPYQRDELKAKNKREVNNYSSVYIQNTKIVTYCLKQATSLIT